MAFEPRKSVRIIAFNSKNVNHMKTVNIVTAKQTGGAANQPHSECLQLTAAQTTAEHKTYMDAGASTVKGLPTIFVSGYSAPA